MNVQTFTRLYSLKQKKHYGQFNPIQPGGGGSYRSLLRKTCTTFFK